jgi:hypothetical protein
MTTDKRAWVWAFKRAYGHRPTAEQLTRYRYWHLVSRQHGFAASGPWEAWPAKPLPPDAIKYMPASVPAPKAQVRWSRSECWRASVAVAANALSVVTVDGRWQLPGKNVPISKPPEAPPAVRTKEERAALIKARALLRKQLKDGPRSGRAVEIAAVEQGLARVLIAAADDLGVRTRRGQWWLPG